MRSAAWLSLMFVCAFTAVSFAATSADHLTNRADVPDVVIRGLVLDAMRAPVAGARVEASSSGASARVSTTTDQTGAFSLRVEPGRYVVRAAADGFRDAQLVMTAWSDTTKPAEFILQVAGVHEAVTVTAPGGYQAPVITTATKTPTLLRDVPQSVTVVTSELINDQMMASLGDVMRYVPGVMVHQGENNRDQVIVRGNSSSADFFVDGVRDDVQYYRDLYNLERVEALKGPNAMIFGRGGAGGVVNRVSKVVAFGGSRDISFQGGMFGNRRLTAGVNQLLNDKLALRIDGMFEDSNSFRNYVSLERGGVTPT